MYSPESQKIRMLHEDSARQAPQGKEETTLREAVVKRVMQYTELNGLEVALERFDVMRSFFSGNHDWPDIESEVTDFFMKKRREAQQAAADRQNRLEQAMLVGLAKGMSIGQANVLTGNNAQAPYFSSTPTIGGHKP